MLKFALTFFLSLFGYLSFSQNDSVKSQIEHNLSENAIQTVISHQDIERSSAKTLASLLNEQAGMVISGAYQPMGSFVNVYMEGYVGGKALIEVDGLPVWDPSSTADNYFDLNFIPLNAIEEIIIKHGSRSTEDGSGAVAGVINIITIKKEGNKKLNLLGQAGLGNEHSILKNIELWGTISKIKYQFSLSGYQTNGFSYAQDTLGNQGYDIDGFKSKVFNSYIEYKPNSNLKLFTYLFDGNYKADTDVDDFMDAKNYYYKSSFLNTGVGFNYVRNNFSVTGNYKYSSTTRAYYDSTLNFEKLTGIANLVNVVADYPLSNRISFKGGLDYRNNEFKHFSTDINYGTIQNKYPTTFQYDAFAFVSYNSLNNRYITRFGYRKNKQNQAGTTNSFSFFNSYQLNKEVVFITNISTGFTVPSIYSAKDSSYGNGSLVSEHSVSYQIGVEFKRNFITQKLMIFKNTLPNGIDFNSNTGTYSNCNGFSIGGAEYETKITLFKNIKLQANYSYTTGNEKTISRQNYTDTVTYHYLVRIPKHMINCKLVYEYGAGNFLCIGGRYVNKYYDVGYSVNDYKMSSFWILNLSSSVNITKRVSMLLGVQNILNNKFNDTRGYNSTPLLINAALSIKI